MGKNLKGKEIGKGICQRKDGLYVARFVNRYGKRCEKSFPSLPLARNWLEEARYADKHSEAFLPSNTTVDEWFDFWITKIVGDLAPNTIRNYRERYIRNMKPIIGHLRLTDVKLLHCKLVLNSMYDVQGFYHSSNLYNNGRYVQIGTIKRYDCKASDGWAKGQYTRP